MAKQIKKDKLLKRYDRLYREVKRQPQRGRHESDEMDEFIDLKETLETVVTPQEKYKINKMFKRALQ